MRAVSASAPTVMVMIGIFAEAARLAGDGREALLSAAREHHDRVVSLLHAAAHAVLREHAGATGDLCTDDGTGCCGECGATIAASEVTP